MTDKIVQSLDQVVATLKSSGAEAVYIFGSAARGTMRPDSDVDLAVSGLPPEKFFKAFSIVSGLIRKTYSLS